MMTIVDGVIGAEAAGSLQLIVGGRCRDDGGAHGLCNLQCKNGDAAGTKDEDRVAGLQRTIDDKGSPRGHAGGGERRSFGERIPFRRAGKRGRRCDNDLARISINAITGDSGKVADSRRAFRPGREKARDDVIAHLELCDALADGFYKASAVRHRDAAIGYSVGRADNGIIMEIE